MAAFEAEVLDVRTAGLADSQPVEAEEHGQCRVHRRGSLGGVEECRQLAAVHAALRCGCTRGRRTYCAGFALIRPSMWAKR